MALMPVSMNYPIFEFLLYMHRFYTDTCKYSSQRISVYKQLYYTHIKSRTTRSSATQRKQRVS